MLRAKRGDAAEVALREAVSLLRPTCLVDLVERLPGPEPVPDVQLACVLRTHDPGLVPLVRALFEDEGIESH